MILIHFDLKYGPENGFNPGRGVVTGLWPRSCLTKEGTLLWQCYLRQNPNTQVWVESCFVRVNNESRATYFEIVIPAAMFVIIQSKHI